MSMDLSRLCFPPKQRANDPLTFEFILIVGASEGVKASVPWLEERGLKWNRGDDGMFYTVTLPDADSAMYFKLAFCS